jgi:DNA-binding NarL/FixJ family response regulator
MAAVTLWPRPPTAISAIEKCIMDTVTNSTESGYGSERLPVVVIIERLILTRTCIHNILTKEFTGFEIIEIATTSDLHRTSGRDIRLIALDIADKPIIDPSVEEDLTVLAELFPDTPIALLSNRDDEETVSAAMLMGVRGFFSTSISVEVAIAGLRLVLAGGVYRPLPNYDRLGLETRTACSRYPKRSTIGEPVETENVVSQKVDLTPREEQVFAALKLGLSNKVIAARLKLSENTVKMHIQHILRKYSARNRTEAVLLSSGLLEKP